MGTLVGAPVGIALLAGIAVPAMIIGIPIWVGRKLYARFKTTSKHKRNIIITSGVAASVSVFSVYLFLFCFCFALLPPFYFLFLLVLLLLLLLLVFLIFCLLFPSVTKEALAIK